MYPEGIPRSALEDPNVIFVDFDEGIRIPKWPEERHPSVAAVNILAEVDIRYEQVAAAVCEDARALSQALIAASVGVRRMKNAGIALPEINRWFTSPHPFFDDPTMTPLRSLGDLAERDCFDMLVSARIKAERNYGHFIHPR